MKRRREVIELPLAPVQVIEHRVLARVCPHCRQRVVPQVALAGAVAGRQRLGTGLVSLIATLREAGRWPVGMVQWYQQTVHRLHLSGGAIVAASHRVAAAGQRAVAAIQAQSRGSPAVQADETGWRENGVNGYVWSCSTPTAAYFTHGSREGAMVDRVLGAAFTGVLGSDFSAGSHHYPGEHQRCWVHLLRDIHDLRLLYPTDRVRLRRMGAGGAARVRPGQGVHQGRPAPRACGCGGGASKRWRRYAASRQRIRGRRMGG